ncbi:unnamed protein product [Aureobasidium vineae]|uniref:Uncharacterized protein n=1 Tax=Aureobasidium vineae TaxID=2773715 RepID=A0A9N8JVY9_9PEZI|nr:unnamed protein product [Aureobasidium vineae]
MSLSPSARDLRFVQSHAPNTFSHLLPEEPTISESSKTKRLGASGAVDSGHEETDDEVPSAQAQPPNSVQSIKPESGFMPVCSTHDVNDAGQGVVRLAVPPIAAEVIATSDGDGGLITRSSSPFSAKVDHEYMSDSDLVEDTYRKAQGYSKLPASTKRTWETERANALFRAGKPKHFECSEHLLSGNPCTTLQEYLPSRSAARPVVSPFFGHNKREWNQIIKSVRVFLCRKCYQRYEHKLHPHLASIQLPLCRELIDRLETWRPGCLFTVQLTKAMQQKIKRFEVKMNIEGAVRQDVAAEVDAEDLDDKSSDVKRASSTPVLFAITFENRFGGNNKTTDELRSLFDWLETELADGNIEDLPAFESLLQMRSHDKEQLEAQQKRRPALKKSLLMEVPTELASTSDRANEPERTPTHSPLSTNTLPPSSGFKAINTISPSISKAGVSITGHVSTDVSVVPKEVTVDTESSGPSSPSAPPKIILKLSRGKKPIGADVATIESQTRITKKRKRDTASSSKDNEIEGDSAAPTEKAKRTKSVLKARIEQHLPDGKAADEPALEAGSNDQAQATDEPHMEVTDGSTHVASLTFSEVKIIDFAPYS